MRLGVLVFVSGADPSVQGNARDGSHPFTYRRVFIKDSGGSLNLFPVAVSMAIATPNSTSLVVL